MTRAIAREIQTTMRSRYGRAVVADALMLGAAEDQRLLAHALAASGEWRCVDSPGNRYLPRIARGMVLLLSTEEVQCMRDSLHKSKHHLKQRQVGRRLLRMLEESV